MATDPKKYKLNYSMLRIKDPKVSIKYYEFLGLRLIETKELPGSNSDLYFLAYDSPKAPHHRHAPSDREGVVGLKHTRGSESDPNFKIATGNAEPGKGFGHLCISVDNIQAACKRIEDAGYKFQKKLSDGRMRHIAFSLDPDGYWVEIIGQNPVDATEEVTMTDTEQYGLNHTMIRVKDAEKSIAFYRDVMGMSLLRTAEMKEARFNLYFLGYENQPAWKNTTSGGGGGSPLARREGLLELTWNYGTEKQADFHYHSGNTEPLGFGQICVTVDDLDAACERFEKLGVKWQKRLTDGTMKNLAFILDCDGYWIEIMQNTTLKVKR
ncbi:MAG: Lactoylglutathione lyase [Thelocarpon superellum]|nr:MAG: Lactoylglutathione lyase [Thelocarpon superellum]